MSWNRQSTTPMEYEYDNVHGPIDERSPFVTAVPNKKRPHSVFDSPSKGLPGAFNTPSRQQLRDPNSQPHFFSQAGQKPLPAVPSHVQNSSVWEPRTPASIIDFSSGGETPNTPAQDSEAATPDTQMANKMGRSMNLEGEGKKSPKKLSKRDSWLQKIFSSSPSPSKEERKPYSKKAENRIMKRRSKNRKLAIRDEYDSDDSIRNKNSQSVNAHGIERPGYATQAGNFFTWLEAHPHLPSVLSFWFQLLVNTILGGAFLYGLWTIWSGVQADIAVEAKKYEVEIMKEIAFCARQYSDNKCEPPTRVPAMEHACGNWHSCMQRNPKQVARASVSAKTFAMILNAFVEEFSYKSMLFTAIVIFGGFNLSNWAFGVIRGKNQQQNSQHHDPNNAFYPPATPHRQASGGFIDQQGYYTPFQTPYNSMNQHMFQQAQAAQSMPALPSTDSVAGALEREDGKKSLSKRRLFA